jgi:hypothetical protein
MPYSCEARAYVASPRSPARLASARIWKNPSNPPGTIMKISRPACGTTRRWACGMPRGRKTKVARAHLELLVAALVDVLTFADVVHLVLVGVHVPRGVQQRS